MSQKPRSVQLASQAGRAAIQPVARLLETGALARFLQRADQLRRATERIRARLGTPLGAHCEVASRRGDTLVVRTDAAAWASRLRFLAPQVLQALSGIEDWSGLRKLQVIVRPPDPDAKPVPARRVEMSVQSADLLRHVAEDIQDSALREALLRLSRRAP